MCNWFWFCVCIVVFIAPAFWIIYARYSFPSHITKQRKRFGKKVREQHQGLQIFPFVVHLFSKEGAFLATAELSVQNKEGFRSLVGENVPDDLALRFRRTHDNPLTRNEISVDVRGLGDEGYETVPLVFQPDYSALVTLHSLDLPSGAPCQILFFPKRSSENSIVNNTMFIA